MIDKKGSLKIKSKKKETRRKKKQTKTLAIILPLKMSTKDFLLKN
jgi:hypothetical protein